MNISFSRPPTQVDCYEFVEVEIRVAPPASANPFTDVTVSGQFTREGGAPLRADGFCDADDGSVFRIRFMPSQPGRHAYSIGISSGKAPERITCGTRRRPIGCWAGGTTQSSGKAWTDWGGSR